jgi:hypothetical protein
MTGIFADFTVLSKAFQVTNVIAIANAFDHSLIWHAP